MRSTAKFLLALLVALAFVVSLISFGWWLVFAYNIVTGHTAIEFGTKFAPQMLEQASQQKILFTQMREYFVLIGGAIGWGAFFALPNFSNRPFRALPKLLLISCVIGITAALVMPASVIFKVTPILTVILIFMRCLLIEDHPKHAMDQKNIET
ncbi:hypothetical protein [Halothiobacillus neapolitanus]|uniref:Uncharacterized protein n=1 Tax=Halothiobacillus neapolitanus (strain ATCC 23641 / DSM 15147 / CIP 104769 / NCIMB 8539 / c2) TaxID=555778 RepID=D0KWE8_HALNC|nr:hypothetical protein [Halothiobacillus neapolitanus]ACX94945.1 hypothetical protein Hneap_0080 [Halothiobacillus neapolitanus c2]TDN57328.1 hypothetical protein C8D83_1175 [Halothiobacillus neapolitanus]